jgi:deoxyribodipyrimidine photolyase
MTTKNILILEDDLKTLSFLYKGLYELEEKLMKRGVDLSLVQMSEFGQVEKYLEDVNREDFDLVLLDRDCKAGGSLHVFNIEAFGADKIISISSVPEYNEQAKGRGVNKVVYKDYSQLDQFCENLVAMIESIIINGESEN